MEFYVRHFFRKISQNFPKISRNFLNFFKIEKTAIFTLKIVHNHYINQNLTKFSLKTPKNSRFFPKNPKFFKIFGAFGAENLEFYVPKIPNFLEKGSPPLGGGSPPKNISGKNPTAIEAEGLVEYKGPQNFSERNIEEKLYYYGLGWY